MPEFIDLELAKPLNVANVKKRDSGRGAKLSYIETHHAIRTANEIFGFGGWGHTISELRFLGSVNVKNRDGKEGVHVGYLCVVQLAVDDRQVTSGVGYGDAVEYRDSGPVTAHELAAKEAESDALKRALKNYGDQFGLALYDKDAANSGHLTDGQVLRHNGKEPAKRATSYSDWETRMKALEIPEPVEWLRLATEAIGGKEAAGNLLERANRVMLWFSDNEPASAVGFWSREEIQQGFGAGFDGVLVTLPEPEPEPAAGEDPGIEFAPELPLVEP